MGERRVEVEPGLAERLEPDRPGGGQLLVLPGPEPEPLDPERLAVEPPRQLTPFVPDFDRGELERAAGEADGARRLGRADGAADPRVGLEPAVDSAGRLGREQRLE